MMSEHWKELKGTVYNQMQSPTGLIPSWSTSILLTEGILLSLHQVSSASTWKGTASYLYKTQWDSELHSIVCVPLLQPLSLPSNQDIFFFTHWRSIAERGGCFQQRVCLFCNLFVCQFVCSHDNSQTIQHLVVRCIVQKSRPSSNVKVTGDKKRKSATFCSGVVLWGAVLRQFYAGWKTGACCLVSVIVCC